MSNTLETLIAECTDERNVRFGALTQKQLDAVQRAINDDIDTAAHDELRRLLVADQRNGVLDQGERDALVARMFGRGA